MRVGIFSVIALMSASVVHAQDAPPLPQSRDVHTLLQQVYPLTVNLQAVQAQVPEPPEPPEGTNAWSLRIHTAGGFTGAGIGSVAITSDGRLDCVAATCASQIAQAQLKPLSSTIASIVDAAWIRHSPTSFCRDCVQTTVVLKRREGDVVRTFVASWDPTQAVTEELRELRRLVFELQGR